MYCTSIPVREKSLNIKPFFYLQTFLLVAFLWGQTGFIYQYKDQQNIFSFSHKNFTTFTRQPGHIYYNALMRNGQAKKYDIDLTETFDIIVEFKEKPLFIRQLTAQLSKEVVLSYKLHFLKFSNALNKIHKEFSSFLNMSLPKPRVEREFFTVFNGISIKNVPHALLNPIQKLPYVKKIHINKRIKAFLQQSVAIIKADSVWSRYNTQGENIIVGVIDTGIDYTHPALGGGLGNGFKVIGGYDYVNNDDDPMDDNGHGTHVAGIIAADTDSIKGVAPRARLVAYKVLNSNGFGNEADLIAAIERSVDPNHDYWPEDHLDVVNISLGNPKGTPDDAVSVALDNASKKGVTFCVAAGNNGYFFSTISSPGCAASAITVGASDKEDKVIDYSSKGPVKKTYAIKPDVIAPGVKIVSTLPDNSYGPASGTSMATPHVSGICALLKSIHSDWGPVELKSALVSTAKDLSEEVMIQGGGRIDGLKAAGVKTILNPANLSFGIDDLDQHIWQTEQKIRVINTADSEQSYVISIENDNPNGISLSAEPNQFHLSSGESQEVIFSLTVDNNQVQPTEKSSMSYGGKIAVLSDADKLHFPWSFVKAAKITLIFDLPSVDLFVANKKYFLDYYSIEWVDKYTAEFIIPSGSYDMMFLYPPDTMGVISFIIREKELFNKFQTLYISSSEAKNNIHFQGVDEQGESLHSFDHYQLINDILFPDSSIFVALFYGAFTDPDLEEVIIRTSDFSERFTMYCGEMQTDYWLENKVNILEHQPLHGLTGDIYLNNEPSEYSSLKINAFLSPYARDPYLAFGSFSRFFLEYGTFGIGFAFPLKIDTKMWKGVLYMNKAPETKHEFNAFISTYNSMSINNSAWFDSPLFKVYEYGIGYTFFSELNALFRFPQGCEVNFGLQPVIAYAYFPDVFLRDSKFLSFLNFTGGSLESRLSDLRLSYYKLYDSEGGLVREDSVKNIRDFVYLSKGKYKYELLNSNFVVENIKGQSKLTAFFDTNKQDPTPPVFRVFQVRNSQNELTAKLKEGDSGYIIFTVADYYLLAGKYSYNMKYQSVNKDSTKLYLKKHGTKDWSLIDSYVFYEDSILGKYYKADIPKTLTKKSSAIDLKISVEDMSGNKTIWESIPSIAVGYFGKKLKDSFRVDNFRALANSKTIQIQWEADVNMDDLYFIVERSKNDTSWSFSGKLWIDKQRNQRKFAFSDSSIRESSVYFYRLMLVAQDGSYSYSNSIKTEYGLKKHFNLVQNFPNPFNLSTTFSFTIPKKEKVSLIIYDILGREVIVLYDDLLDAGAYSIQWDGKNKQGLPCASGLYIYRLKTDFFTDSKKLIIIK